MNRICVFVLLFLVQSCVSQECKSPCDLPITTCTFVDYPVYPVGLNISANEAQASGIVNMVRSFGGLINQDCQDAVSKYTCGVLYPACEDLINERGVPVANKLRPCLRMCEDVHTTCAQYMSALPADYRDFVDCSQLNPDGTPKFSSDIDCYALENLIPDKGCDNPNRTAPTNKVQSGCQTYDPSKAPLTNAACAPFVSSEIFVVDALNPNMQTYLDSVANASGVYVIDKVRMVIPYGCYKHLMSLLCQTAFPTCIRVPNNETGEMLEASASPCYENCEAIYEECGELFALSDVQPVSINCSSINPTTGAPNWPPGPTYITYLKDQNISVELECSSILFPPNATASFAIRDADCPPFLVKTYKQTDSDRMCWVPCPDPSYTAKMWDKLVVLCLIAGSISLSLMFFMLVSYVTIAEYRKRYMHMGIFISAALLSTSFLIGGRNPQESVWCVDPSTFSDTSNNPACEIQGFLFQFSALSVATWWLTIAFHMFRRIVIAARTSLKRVIKYYTLFAWGLPFIITLLTSLITGHGFTPPTPFCYIKSPGAIDLTPRKMPHVPVDYFVFVMPLGLTLIIAACLMAAVAHKVWRILHESTSIREQTKSDITVQRRLIFFVILLLGILTILFSWRFFLQASHGAKMIQEDIDFILCKLKNNLELGYSDACPGEELPKRFNYDFTAVESFISAGMGIFIFLALGTDKAIYRFWYRLSHLPSNQMLQYVKDGSASSARMPASFGSAQQPLENSQVNIPTTPLTQNEQDAYRY